MDQATTRAEEILELERESFRRFEAGAMDGVMEFMADNVMLFNPGSEILVGKDHERALLTEASQVEGLEMSWEPTGAHVSESGDMAYAYGTIRVKTPEGAEQFEKYVTIWRKADGQWKVALQIRNSNS